jgi:hypothetical protein
LTLRDDADLEPFAVPETTDATGSTVYGQDGYWFAPTVLRAALRGGTWNRGLHAGVFAVSLTIAPGLRYVTVGCRACKSL